MDFSRPLVYSATASGTFSFDFKTRTMLASMLPQRAETEFMNAHRTTWKSHMQQTMRVAGLALMGALCCFLVTLATAQTNSVTGDCALLAKRIQSPGVVDDMGVPHANNAGWTNATFDAGVEVSGVQPYGDTKHTKAGKACYQGTAKVTFTVVTKVSTLTWTPATACDQCSCNKACLSG